MAIASKVVWLSSVKTPALQNLKNEVVQIPTQSFFEKNGNRYTYSVNDFKVNTSIPDSEFNFDKSKYPKVEVVDLR